MQRQKIVAVGAQLGFVMPKTLERTLGWCRGDQIAIYESGGRIIIENDTKRSARFTRTRAGTRDASISAEAR